MTGQASRATVDFDAFERELRQADAQPQAAAGAKSADPLAELARIVGQDDPFRALLESREKAGEGRPGRVEPIFVDAPAHPQDGQPAMTAPAPHAAAQSPADAFDQYLASVEQGLYAGGPGDDPAAFAEAEEGYRAGPVERPRGRGRLVQVGAGLAVLAVCVGGALAWRGTHGGGGSGPITVLADKTPLKVQPVAADGVEIPDQNKQIYDRTAKDGQIRIVNREEQPLDVGQAARTAAARSESAGPGQGGATPGQNGLLTDSLGEPRRVRTVSVKPDTPVLNPPSQAQTHADAGPASPIPTMTMPDTGGATPAATPAPAATPRRPSRTLASAAASVPSSVPDATASTEPLAQAAAPTPAPRKATQRVASVSPETTASTPAEPPADTAPAVSQASVGGYAVQLGVRGSESEARAALKQMQAKYSQLSGKPELIRQAEVNGKSIYRVRVGPLAKGEASSLCTELQGAGGQCFVAKN